jgi:hypothetical protein
MTFVDEKVLPVMTSDLARFYGCAPDQSVSTRDNERGTN